MRPASIATMSTPPTRSSTSSTSVRGKRRLHKKPDTAEVEACHPWIDAELAAVRGRVHRRARCHRRPVAARQIGSDRRQPWRRRFDVNDLPDARDLPPVGRAARRRTQPAEIRTALVDDLRRASELARSDVTPSSGSVAPDGRTSDWRGVVYPTDLPPTMLVRALPAAVRHGRAELDFYRLPDPEAVEHGRRRRRRASSSHSSSAPSGHIARSSRDAGSWLPNHLDRATGSVSTSARRSCSCHRGGDATSTGSTSSSSRRRPRCGGRSSCAIRRGCTTTCSRCSAATAPRSASTTCCRPSLRAHHRLDLRPVPWPRRHQQPYHGSYGGRATDSTGPTSCNRLLDGGRDVYAYFNNDWHGAAVQDAAMLRRLLRG